jgi:hypothetical protein
MSIRAIVRMTGASKNTVVKLMENAGQAFSEFQDTMMRGLKRKRIQVDEIWSFVYAKEKERCAGQERPAARWRRMDLDGDRRRYQAHSVVVRRRSQRRVGPAIPTRST